MVQRSPSGSITSSGSSVTTWSFGAMGSTVSASTGADIKSWSEVTKSITTSAGPVTVWAYGDVSGAITSAQQANVESWGNITGPVQANGGDAASLGTRRRDRQCDGFG